MSSIFGTIKAVAMTMVGSVVGAAAGGPIGLGAGMAGGGLIDFLRHKYGKPALPLPMIVPPSYVTPGVLPGGLGAPLAAANQVTITYTVNGRPGSMSITPDPMQLANDISQAQILAKAGHGAGKEGEFWVARAKADGASANPISFGVTLAQLKTAGYAV